VPEDSFFTRLAFSGYETQDDAMHLSKTKVLAGLQCDKQLYLRVHHPELAEATESPLTVTGKVVEAHARQEFPDAVLVERGRAAQDPFTVTEQLLQDPAVSTLFEAAIRDTGLALFVDVLQRRAQGWELTEIKAGTAVKDKHIDDVAIQALALARAGVAVNRFWLMHINNEFVYAGQQDYSGLFVREDITAQVLAHIPYIKHELERLITVIAGAQPERHIGSYCKNPYPCPFRSYCEATETDYPVAYLPNGWRVAQTLLAQGIDDIRDIPVGALTSETHQRVRAVTITGQAELLPGARKQLAALLYPRYYLDFECIQFAIPIWAGTQPYAQLPFQWSCHIQGADGQLEHEEFLGTTGEDPRRAFAETLLTVCGEQGPIIVYNQSFEKRIIKELAACFPDLAGPLLALNERVFDLLPVVKQHYYHPAMKGSWSIKSVLSCLVPELSYKDLGRVQEGTMAQAVYLEMITGKLSGSEKEACRRDLLAYCELDTLAMVKIVENILHWGGKEQEQQK
jgi:hypothetical protein